jgi:hypothetical protein
MPSSPKSSLPFSLLDKYFACTSHFLNACYITCSSIVIDFITVTMLCILYHCALFSIFLWLLSQVKIFISALYSQRPSTYVLPLVIDQASRPTIQNVLINSYDAIRHYWNYNIMIRNKILTFVCRSKYDLEGHDLILVRSRTETSTSCRRQMFTVLVNYKTYSI